MLIFANRRTQECFQCVVAWEGNLADTKNGNTAFLKDRILNRILQWGGGSAAMAVTELCALGNDPTELCREFAFKYFKAPTDKYGGPNLDRSSWVLVFFGEIINHGADDREPCWTIHT
jgi:hypothetical protein